MLFVCNGAFKSGSTWLFQIVRELTGSELVPREYLDAHSTLPRERREKGTVASIRPNRLNRLLGELDYHDKSYVAKNHFSSRRQRDLLLAHDDTFVLDIVRDLRDVLVSAYYHDQRVKGFRGGFRDYFYGLGRVRARQVLTHHRCWSLASPRVYVADYARLKEDFETELSAIAAFLGIGLDREQIEVIRERTSFRTLRAKRGREERGENFFRKGVVGDWQEHFDTAMLEDIVALQRRGGPPAWHIPLLLVRSLPRLALPNLADAVYARMMRGGGSR